MAEQYICWVDAIRCRLNADVGKDVARTKRRTLKIETDCWKINFKRDLESTKYRVLPKYSFTDKSVRSTAARVLSPDLLEKQSGWVEKQPEYCSDCHENEYVAVLPSTVRVRLDVAVTVAVCCPWHI